MERYNLFQLIHKGLRASLLQVSLQLQHTDYGVEEEAEETIGKVFEVLMLFRDQADKEKKYILPLVNEWEPALCATLENFNLESDNLSVILYKLVERFSGTDSVKEKLEFSISIIDTFQSYTILNLRHLSEKETVVNHILWRHYTDEAIMHHSGRMERNTPPWIADFYAGWIARGLNDRELVQWLTAIRVSMPAIAYRSIIQKIQKDFSRTRFQKINHYLSEAMLAFAN